ncbi:hypothetical protein B5F40_02930 [Gordonibacter sp. An230]|uniref:GNAT family N-acetyltransferase n=1 Tax=Gordonibacter sp. An230 TaxID=1965592 RepID=UPI000B38D8FE|nr:GNAT family N-acetyltransferase [Gordonibacter sp. An230]OUO91802.1 hypothetical protein B5F40_02930 [Gordonibacter sp. An230]
MAIAKTELTRFLRDVSDLFPIPLSEKVDIGGYAEKLLSCATLVPEFREGRLVGLVAGYTDNLPPEGLAYIALVGVRRDFQRCGIAKKLVEGFIDVCRQKGIRGLHLYTDAENRGAVHLYRGMGFERVTSFEDRRPNDIHFRMMLDRPIARPSDVAVRARKGSAALVTAIGSFSAEAVISGLHRSGLRVVGCDINPRAWLANAIDVDVFHKIPAAKDGESFVAALLDVCREEEAACILPLTDYEVDALSVYRGSFEEKGIHLLLPSKRAVEVCRNKLMFSSCFERGVDGVEVVPAKPVGDVCPFAFPVVCKPVDGRSSEGVVVLNSRAEWMAFAPRDGYVVQPFVRGHIATVDVVRHPFSGRVVSVPRIELLRTPNGAGTSVFVFRDVVLERACTLLAEKLDVVGCVNFEFIRDADGVYHLLECNPRFSGGLSFTCGIGYDVVGNHLACFSGSEDIEPLQDYQPRFFARRYEQWTTWAGDGDVASALEELS